MTPQTSKATVLHCLSVNLEGNSGKLVVSYPNPRAEKNSWEHNLETKISCRLTEYFCAKSACA
jgi:hypothetical protein